MKLHALAFFIAWWGPLYMAVVGKEFLQCVQQEAHQAPECARAVSALARTCILHCMMSALQNVSAVSLIDKFMSCLYLVCLLPVSGLLSVSCLFVVWLSLVRLLSPVCLLFVSRLSLVSLWFVSGRSRLGSGSAQAQLRLSACSVQAQLRLSIASTQVLFSFCLGSAQA